MSDVRRPQRSGADQSDLIPVDLLKNFRNWNKGETAGFNLELVEWMLANGVAELHDPVRAKEVKDAAQAQRDKELAKLKERMKTKHGSLVQFQKAAKAGASG